MEQGCQGRNEVESGASLDEPAERTTLWSRGNSEKQKALTGRRRRSSGCIYFFCYLSLRNLSPERITCGLTSLHNELLLGSEGIGRKISLQHMRRNAHKRAYRSSSNKVKGHNPLIEQPGCSAKSAYLLALNTGCTEDHYEYCYEKLFFFVQARHLFSFSPRH